MAAVGFPSILPMESSAEPDLALSIADFESLLCADELSKSALLSTSVTLSASVHAIGLLEKSRDWLKRTENALHHRHNQLVAIQNEQENMSTSLVARLPAELIRTIFALDAECFYLGVHEEYDPSQAGVGTRWLRLGAVCRRWRLILFEFPHIWASDLCGFGSKKALKLLPFAKNLPLNIYLDEDDGRDILSGEKQQVYELLPRARALTIKPQKLASAHGFIDCLSSKQFPRLRSLSFCTVDEIADVYFPHAALTGLPRLTSMTLSYSYIKPPTPGCLLRLDIDLSEQVDDQKPSLDNILDVLSQNPTLEELRLSCCVKITHSNGPPRHHVHLPHLIELEYFDYNVHVSDLVDHLCAPSLHEADIHCPDQYDSLNSALRSLKSVLGAWVQPQGRRQSGLTEGTLGATFCASMERRLRGQESEVKACLEGCSKTLGAGGRLSMEDTQITGNGRIRFIFKYCRLAM